jgi:hypothetical protein
MSMNMNMENFLMIKFNFNFNLLLLMLLLLYLFSYYYSFCRSFEKYGCEKIEGKYCICFIENPNQVLIDKITHVMKIYRGEKSSYRDDNTFILMTDLDISIISEFLIRYGKSLEEEKRQMQTMSMMNANVVAW